MKSVRRHHTQYHHAGIVNNRKRKAGGGEQRGNYQKRKTPATHLPITSPIAIGPIGPGLGRIRPADAGLIQDQMEIEDQQVDFHNHPEVEADQTVGDCVADNPIAGELEIEDQQLDFHNHQELEEDQPVGDADNPIGLLG